MTTICCRACASPLVNTFVDLGLSPLSNSYVSVKNFNQGEMFYPLHAYVCSNCFLVQLAEFEKPEHIFSGEYAYFSSYSASWLNHAQRYTDSIIRRFSLRPEAHITEVASNDGYLLQYFLQQGMRVTGIEPADNCAAVAKNKGIHTEICFFSAETADRIRASRGPADLIVANNVLAHVPDLHSFIEGFARLLAPQGVATFEFPHLLNLIALNQFDTIYHEHFSYLSLLAIQPVFSQHKLRVFDAESIPTHGGSLRLYVCSESAKHQNTQQLEKLRDRELLAGLQTLEAYQEFSKRVQILQGKIWEFVLRSKSEKKTIAAYGAAAKGNTLLNYCGLRSDHISYVVDLNPAKQGKYLPGSRIPIHPVDKIIQTKPDYVWIFPWNISDEIKQQMQIIRSWGGRFVTAIPDIVID